MQGRGMVSRSFTWTVFSSRIRLPASHDRTTFWAIWSWGPAAGPTGLAARRPWNSTEVSRAGSPCQNLRRGRSKTFPSRSYSRSIRRRRTGNGAGQSSATGPYSTTVRSLLDAQAHQLHGHRRGVHRQDDRVALLASGRDRDRGPLEAPGEVAGAEGEARVVEVVDVGVAELPRHVVG